MENRSGWKPIRIEEFQESDIWDLMDEREAIVITKCRKPEQSPIGPVSRQLPSAAMLIPRAKKSPSPSPSPSPEPKLAQHSAPVNIPDWSKIYGKSPIGNSSSSDEFDGKRFIVKNEDDDDDEEMGGRIVVPPHEGLAKKQISSLSVCEGAGRTLKGRDLRRVRHDVLTKTGFI